MKDQDNRKNSVIEEIGSKSFLISLNSDKKINKTNKIFDMHEGKGGKKKNLYAMKKKMYFSKKTKNKISTDYCRSKNYEQKIWKKNYFIIIYYVSTFISKILNNYSKIRFKKMKKLHYSIINDNASMSQVKESFNYKNKTKKKYLKFVETLSHKTNMKRIKFEKLKYCNFYFKIKKNFKKDFFKKLIKI